MKRGSGKGRREGRRGGNGTKTMEERGRKEERRNSRSEREKRL